MPQPAGHSRHVDAYQVALPVTISSGACTRENRFFSGGLQPAAREMLPIPAILRKVRRFISNTVSQIRKYGEDNVVDLIRLNIKFR